MRVSKSHFIPFLPSTGGTLRYRAIVRDYQSRYRDALKQGKGKIAIAIVNAIRSKNGRFLRIKKGSWIQVSVKVAKEQTVEALRRM
jgi:hypothetical protein